MLIYVVYWKGQIPNTVLIKKTLNKLLEYIKLVV